MGGTQQLQEHHFKTCGTKPRENCSRQAMFLGKVIALITGVTLWAKSFCDMDDPDGLIEADTHSKGFSKVLLSILGHKGGVAFNERGWEMGEPILGYKEWDGGGLGSDGED